ncbi:MAG TPA: MauE/DoxX family redox-associated membrane protein [Actinomycetota bacterium]|nr:MauE/DoxX family redox-associated membrane protein [Actinomycetota bacterium]
MVETITPVVHGGRAGRWAGSVALHVTGAVASAAAFGAILGGAGSLLGAPWGGGGALLIALVAALYLVREATVVPVPVPQLRRQVPQWWRTFFSVPVAAFLYGVGLGVGFLTYLAHGTLVVVALAAAASGEPLVGAALVAPFGLARGLSVLVAVRARRPQEGSALVARLARSASSPGWRAANGAALFAVGVAAAVMLPASGVLMAPLSAAVLGAAFGWSAGTKIARPASWRRVPGAYGLPPRVQRISVIGVPVAEVAIVGLVVVGMHRTAGIVALAILAAFSAATLQARRRFGNVLACGCFGTSVERDYRILLLRNAVLAGGASIAALGGVDAPRISVSLPTDGDALPAALAVTGIVVAAWMLASSLRSLRVRRIA